MATRETETIERAAARAGQYRWVVVGLLFAATVINYIDRQMIGVLKPVLSADLGWSETDFANVIFWFQAAYAIGYLGFGRSEEHTSELQSLMRISYAVFCLKKKKNITQITFTESFHLVYI